MRNDYNGFGLLKDLKKYQNKIVAFLLKDIKDIKQKTLIRVKIYSMNYNETIKELKRLGL